MNSDRQSKFEYGFVLQVVACGVMLAVAVVMRMTWRARVGNKVLSNTSSRV